MIEMSATVLNTNGIHCRPSAVIAKETLNYEGRITIIYESHTCDPRSVMALITLGLHEGSKIKIQVEGPDENTMCRKLVKLFETHFDFPPREDGEPPFALPVEEGESVAEPPAG